MNNDLISRSALIYRLEGILRMAENEPIQTYANAIRLAIGETRLAPSVDAVEVVRCKNCKHWVVDSYWNGNPDQIRACRFAGWMCGANGYCLYGERKEDTEVNDHGSDSTQHEP